MRKPLGKMLVEAGVIDEAALKMALAEQARTGLQLGRTLLDLRMLEEGDLIRVLGEQLHMPRIDLEPVEIPKDVLALVPPAFAQQHAIIPFALTGKFLDVAMADPTNLSVIDELRIRTRLNIRPYLIGARMIDRVIAKHYGGAAPNLGERLGPSRTRTKTQSPDSIPFEATDNIPFDTSALDDNPFATDDPPATVDVATAPPREPKPPTQPPPVAKPPAPADRLRSATLQRPGPGTTPPPLTALGRDRDGNRAEIDALVARVAQLEALVLRGTEGIEQLQALVERDEQVLKKLLALLIEKGIATRDEIVERLG